MGPEHSVYTGQKVKYLLVMIACDHEIMHMSKMMLAKDRQGTTREFERTGDFLSNVFSNRETTHKIENLILVMTRQISRQTTMSRMEDLSPATSPLTSFLCLFNFFYPQRK